MKTIVISVAMFATCQSLMAQSVIWKGKIMADSLAEVEYAFEHVYFNNPPIPVPGRTTLADSTGIHPLYFPSGDQEFLLLKGPVVGFTTRAKREGDVEDEGPYYLDDNGWFLPAAPLSSLSGMNITRDPKNGNRIKSATFKDDNSGIIDFKYDDGGWLTKYTYHGNGYSTTTYYNHNYYHDLLSEKITDTCWDEDGTITKTELVDEYIFNVTETDCFHNWIERDVLRNNENGETIGKWHESRTLYYLSVIDKDRGSLTTRPFTGTQKIGLISSDEGGRMFFHYGTKWKYVRIWGKNEQKTRMKTGTVLQSVLEKPAYPGGQKELNSYLQDNLQYPETALKEKAEGTVKVRFEVSETGKISNIEIVQSVSPELDEEAIRLIEDMKEWTPAKKDGQIVTSRHTLHLKFSIK